MILKTAANMQEHGYIETGKEGGYYEVDGQRTEIGGGSSDFSTADVEFKNETTTNLNIRCCCIVDNNIESTVVLSATQTKTCTAVLYKGSQQVEIPFGVELTTVTGDITVDSEEGIITINGSGTVLFRP